MTIRALVDKYIGPVIAAFIGWLGSLGVPLPEDTDQTILAAVAVIIAAIILPIIDFIKQKLRDSVGKLFK